MRSLRLDPKLDREVRRAAALKGESVSEFIRQAAAQRAEETLTARRSEQFADVAGAVRSGGGRARRSGQAFAEELARTRHRR